MNFLQGVLAGDVIEYDTHDLLGHILELLNNPESNCRQLGIRCLTSNWKLIEDYLQGETDDRQRVTRILHSVITSEENLSNAMLAGILLGRIVEVFGGDDAVIEPCAERLMAAFELCALNENVELFIYSISAIGRYLEIGSNSHPRRALFCHHSMERLRDFSSKDHPLILVALLRALRRNINDNSKNRFEFIYPVMGYVRELFLQLEGDRWVETQMHASIKEEASRFLCHWIPWAPDGYLARLTQDQRQDLVSSLQPEAHLDSVASHDIGDVANLLKLAGDRFHREEKPNLTTYLKGGGHVLRRKINHMKPLPVCSFSYYDNCKTNLSFTSNLTFMNKRRVISFVGPSYVIPIHITNQSSEKSEFYSIQTHPSEYFFVSPAFGVVKPNASGELKLHFVPNENDTQLASSIVNGFLRVRTEDGFLGDRISLSACNGPLMAVLDSELDFGYCAFKYGHTRQLPILVQNMSRIASNCNLFTESSIFSVENANAVVLPGQTVEFLVGFHPNDCIKYTDTLTIQGMGGETHRVKLLGHGGQPLRVLDDILDFGHVKKNSRNPYIKQLTVMNMDNEEDLQVDVESTDPLGVSAGSVVVPRGGTLAIPVELHPLSQGSFMAELKIRAPRSWPVRIPVHAFVDEIVGFPFHPEIHFPVHQTGSPCCMDIPIVNYSDAPCEFRLSGIFGTAFSVRIKDVLMQSSTSIVLQAHEEANAKVEYSSVIVGFDRVSVRLEILHPTKITTGPWYFMIGSVGKDISGNTSKPFSVSQLQFLVSDVVKTEDDDIDDESDDDEEEYIPGLVLSQKSILFYKSSVSIELQNPTGVLCSYMLLVSKPFKVDGSILGELQAHDKIVLDIQIDVSKKSFKCFRGFISVLQCIRPGAFSAKQYRVACSAIILGLNDTMVGTYSSEGSLKIACASIEQKEQRSITLENRSPQVVQCQAHIQHAESTSVFKFDDSKVNLEVHLPPWGRQRILIDFCSKSEGVFNIPLLVNFLSIKDGDIWLQLFNGSLEAAVCSIDKLVTPEIVDFGEVFVGESVIREIPLSSTGELRCSVCTPVPFSCSTTSITTTSEEKLLKLSIQPKRPGSVFRFLNLATAQVHGKSDYKLIALKACGGTIRCISNFGDPCKVKRGAEVVFQSQDTIAFGTIYSGQKRCTQSVRITNIGTLDMTVVDIRTDSRHLIHRISSFPNSKESRITVRGVSNEEFDTYLANVAADALYAEFAVGKKDAPAFVFQNEEEVDWDELDFQATRHVKETIERYLKTKKKPRKGRLSLIVAGNESAIAQSTPTLLAPKEVYPMVVGPGRYIDIMLEFVDFKSLNGETYADLELILEGGSCSFRTVAVFQPPLHCSAPNLDFGVIGMGNMRSLWVEISNFGLIALQWEAVLNVNCEDVVDGLVSISPVSGCVDAGSKQKIKLTVSPKCISNSYRFSGNVNLTTKLNDLSFAAVCTRFTGAAGVAMVMPEGEVDIEFGSIEIGTVKTMKFELENVGNMDADFKLVDEDKSRFKFSPDVGVIRAGETFSISIEFSAVSERELSHSCFIEWETSMAASSEEDVSLKKVLEVHLTGAGGVAELGVRQSVVDFGLSLFQYENKRTFDCYNSGTAEAMVRFDMSSNDLYLENHQEYVVVPPHSNGLSITVVFKPSKQTALKSHMKISWGMKSFEIACSGTVGIPNLNITPARAFEMLNFGISLVRESHVRSFTVTNIGDVDLDFNIVFLRPNASAIARENEKNFYNHGLSADGKELLNEMVSSDESEYSDDDVMDLPHLQAEAAAYEIQLQTRPWMDRYPDFENDYEIFDPVRITVDPKQEVFSRGVTIHFTVVYEPTEREQETRALLWIQNKFKIIAPEIRGIGGDPLMELDTPLKTVDFGVCDAALSYTRGFHVINTGNVAYKFKVKADPNDGPLRALMIQCGYQIEETANETKRKKSMARVRRTAVGNNVEDDYDRALKRALAKLGFSYTCTGECSPYSKSPVSFVFSMPASKAAIDHYTCKLILEYAGGFEPMALRARIGFPRLEFYDQDDTPFIHSELDVGTCAVNNTSCKTILLKNTGKAAASFYLRHRLQVEFVVEPSEGKILAGETLPLQVLYAPKDAKVHHSSLRLLYNSTTHLDLGVRGEGGSGKIALEYVSDRDVQLQGMDFQLVTTGFCMEKKLLVHNHGKVPLTLTVESTSPSYTLGTIDHIQQAIPGYRSRISMLGVIEQVGVLSKKKRRRGSVKVSDSIEEDDSKNAMIRQCEIDPGYFMMLRVLLSAEKEKSYTGLLKLKSQFETVAIPLRARGGVVKLSHEGDLDFGNMACDHTYTRKLKLFNKGSIPSTVELFWRFSKNGRDFEYANTIGERVATLFISGTSTRFGRIRLWHWAVEQVLKKIQSKRLTLLKRQKNKSFRRGSALHKDHPMFNAQNALVSIGDSIGSKVENILGRFNEYHHEQQRQQDMLQHEFETQHVSNNEKGSILKLTKSGVIEQQLIDSDFALPHIHVAPRSGTISERIDMEVIVSLNSSIAANFKADLVVSSLLPGVPLYFIPLNASPQEMLVVVDDASTINFGRQALGESRILQRMFTNKGGMPLEFRTAHDNPCLVVVPSEGTLDSGESVSIEIIFTPATDSLWNNPVYFETNCTDPIVIPFYGGGGFPQIDLDSFEVMDFGRCMVSKSIPKQLRIGNRGNALLNIIGFQLVDTRRTTVFQKGAQWPHDVEATRPVKVLPGEQFYLPLTFHPYSEERFESFLTIITTTNTYTIALVGTGREAVLSLSKSVVDFIDCIVGNAYQTSLDVTNAGDLQYPLKISVAGTFDIGDDVKIHPKEFSIHPFETQTISITYVPTKTVDVKDSYISLASVYSNFQVPLNLIAGTADLQLEPANFDFGHFEKNRPTQTRVTFSNRGSMAFSFRISRLNEESKFPFRLSRWQGALQPEQQVDIVAHFLENDEVMNLFSEELVVETDLVGSMYFINLCGHCDFSTLDSQEFSNIKLGYCIVEEIATKVVEIQNYGGYPAELQFRPAYPIKVFPKSLTIPGNEKGSVTVQWKPKGGYELKSTVKVITNIGTYDMTVQGVGVYPRFRLLGSRIDFGICGPGHVYERQFQIVNTGKVPLEWTIPSIASGYKITPNSGSLSPKEEVSVQVAFEPLDIGRYPGDLIVESRGQYKIVNCSGMGGKFQIDIDNSQIEDMGETPCMGASMKKLFVTNSGGVGVELHLTTKERISSEVLQLLSPSSFSLTPKASVELVFAITPKLPEPFEFIFELACHEGTWPIRVSGCGYCLPQQLVHSIIVHEKEIGEKDDLSNVLRAIDVGDHDLKCQEREYDTSSPFLQVLLPPPPFILEESLNSNQLKYGVLFDPKIQ